GGPGAGGVRGAGAGVGWEVTIEPLEPGTHEIGPIELTLSDGAGDAAPVLATVRTPPVKVVVESTLTEEQLAAGLAAMKEVVDPKDPVPWALWLGGAGALAALLACGTWLMLRRGREAEPVIERRPAHELALARLDQLLASGLLERGAWREYYGSLSLILRRYIEDRFGLHAPER
ncbi:MAG TPA: hypothetical protein DEB06_05800, partial [Phycisphaerales bacterium]|nr:hypothetical protein [Phycisphaerales bacterium]